MCYSRSSLLPHVVLFCFSLQRTSHSDSVALLHGFCIMSRVELDSCSALSKDDDSDLPSGSIEVEVTAIAIRCKSIPVRLTTRDRPRKFRGPDLGTASSALSMSRSLFILVLVASRSFHSFYCQKQDFLFTVLPRINRKLNTFILDRASAPTIQPTLLHHLYLG